MANHPELTFAQQPPKGLTGISLSDWYNEMLHYCKVGYEHKGNRITGDHFWFLNFYRINLNYVRKDGTIFDEVGSPLYCQTDDWLYKQIEEAHEFNPKKPKILLVTGRGMGKTHNVVSIGDKGFYTKPNFTGVISSSTETLVKPTFNVFRTSIDLINKAHPSIAISLLKNTDEELHVGEVITDEGDEENKKTKTGKGYIERIIYKKKDVTRGRRLDYQHFEEVGAWNQPGVATLEDCLTASEGTFSIGEYKKCRTFLTGTGGSVTSIALKKIFYDPDKFNIFVPREYEKRKAIFLPSQVKWGGTYEETGIPDVERALPMIMAEREVKKGDIDAFLKHCSEYPIKEEEVFRLSGTNSFPQDLIARAIQNITEFKTSVKPKKGKFFRNKQSDLSQGIVFEESQEGPVWIYEEPEKNYNVLTGEKTDFSNLYIAGYDGIDQGTSDSSSKGGSKLSLVIKKGMNPNLKLSSTVNKYVCKINYRPQEVEDAYEQSMLALIYYNAKVNIEYSKINIVAYFKKNGQHWRFIKRPKLTVSDGLQEKDTNLIGTIANETNWGYGIGFIKQYVKENWDQLDDLEMCEQLKDFTYENKTDFDIISAMCWCEIAYSEVIIKPMTENTGEVINIGYYTDPTTGQKKYGQKPTSFSMGITPTSLSNIKYIDLQKNRAVYDNE